MKIVTLVAVLLVGCASSSDGYDIAARCTAEDEGNCPGNGGGGSPPSGPNARENAAVDDWMSAAGETQDPAAARICTPSGSLCSVVTTRVVRFGLPSATVSCTITTVTTNGNPTTTASCHVS